MQQKSQVANLMGSFASGIIGLMGTLVRGWTALPTNEGVEMANQFGDFADVIMRDGPNLIPSPTRDTGVGTSTSTPPPARARRAG